MEIRFYLGTTWQLWPLVVFERAEDARVSPFFIQPNSGWRFSFMFPFIRLELSTLGYKEVPEADKIVDKIMEKA